MINVPKEVVDALVAPARSIKTQVFMVIDDVTVDITGDFMSLDTSDEITNNDGDIPYGCVSCNKATLELDNLSMKYLLDNTESPYYKKLVAQMKVMIRYSVKVKGTWYDLPDCIYYTDTWKSSTDSGVANVICLDYLSLFAQSDVPEFRVKENITFYDAFKLLFSLMGIPEKKYNISNKLKLPMQYFWNTGEVFQTQLQTLCTAALANVFVDKKEVIQVTSLIDPSESIWSINDSELLVSLNSEPTYDSIYSAIRVTFDKFQNKTIKQIYSNDTVVLTPGVNSLNNLAFDSNLVVKVISANLSAGKNLSIQNIEFSNKVVSLEIYNGSTSTQTVSLTIFGETLETVESLMRFDNRRALANNVLELKLNYILSPALIAIFARRILANYSGLVKELTLNVRAMPILDVYDRITVTSASTNINQEYRIKQINNTFDAGLTGTIVVTVPTDKSASQYVFLGPGQIIGI